VAVTVLDRQRRPATGLARGDFELFVDGEPRPIVEFDSDATPVSLAILVDNSGSMGIPPNQELAREAVGRLLDRMTPGTDEIALFGFAKGLRLLEPFTTAPADIARRMLQVEAWGETSLFDAIADTSTALTRRDRPRGAVITVTDGVDTSSRLDGVAVARIVGAADLPLYVLATAWPGRGRDRNPVSHPVGDPVHSMDELARYTGGQLYMVSDGTSAGIAAGAIVSELRHQYLIGFEPGARTGWHPLVIRTRQKSLTVRARGGYFTGAPDAHP